MKNFNSRLKYCHENKPSQSRVEVISDLREWGKKGSIESDPIGAIESDPIGARGYFFNVKGADRRNGPKLFGSPF